MPGCRSRAKNRQALENWAVTPCVMMMKDTKPRYTFYVHALVTLPLCAVWTTAGLLIESTQCGVGTSRYPSYEPRWQLFHPFKQKHKNGERGRGTNRVRILPKKQAEVSASSVTTLSRATLVSSRPLKVSVWPSCAAVWLLMSTSTATLSAISTQTLRKSAF